MDDASRLRSDLSEALSGSGSEERLAAVLASSRFAKEWGYMTPQEVEAENEARQDAGDPLLPELSPRDEALRILQG